MRYLLVVSCWLLVASCARDEWRAPMAPNADSTAALLGLPPAKKYVLRGPVNITVQHGNNNVATPTATGKVKAEAAVTAPGGTATATTKKGLPWWWPLVAAGLAGLIVNKMVRGRWAL